MNNDQLWKIVDQYNQKNDTEFGDIKVVRVPDHKTVFVEQIGADGRSVMMTECKLEGATYWAGFSRRSNTVYISRAI